MKSSNPNQAKPATQSQFHPVNLRSVELADEFIGVLTPDQASASGGTATVDSSNRVKLVRQSALVNKAKAENARPADVRPATSRPAIVRAAPMGMDVKHAGTIVRQDGPSPSQPRLLPEQRLQNYVRQLEDLHPQKRTPEAATQSMDVAKTLTPPGKKSVDANEPSALAKMEAIAIGNQSFVSKTDFDSAEDIWGTPKIFQTMDLAKSIMPDQPKSRRVDTTHLDGRQQGAHLAFPQEVAPEEVGAPENEAVKEPVRELTFNEQAAILNDPQTQNLVALISSAIASVLNEEPEEEVLPQAKSLFEKNLQQHAVLLAGDQVTSSSTDAGISDAMVDAIAAQRETNAQISKTLSPSALADQLRQKIAMHQQAQAQNETALETTEIETAAIDALELAVESATTSPTCLVPAEEIEIRSPGAHPVGAEHPVDTEHPADAEHPVDAEATVPPIVSFTKPEEAMIPLSAAAWDVEDFRWPAVADQMIVDGGEAISQLLNAALLQTPGSPKRIAISGAGRSQGATTISITLARWAAACGLKTLIVDADVANPNLSGRVGLSSNLSWLNGINKDLPSSELIIRSRKTNLCLMPLASTVTRVTWPRFIFDNLGQLLAPVAENFDLILIDAGPASQLLDELSNPGLMVDGAILVDSTASAKELEVYQTRLTTFGIASLVVAENRKVEPASNVA